MSCSNCGTVASTETSASNLFVINTHKNNLTNVMQTDDVIKECLSSSIISSIRDDISKSKPSLLCKYNL